MNIVVLGAGRVGRAMAIDLASDSRFRVRVVDRDASNLAALAAHGVAGERQDLSSAEAVAASRRLC